MGSVRVGLDLLPCLDRMVLLPLFVGATLEETTLLVPVETEGLRYEVD